MSTAHGERLRSALIWARQRPVRILVLMGGADFWSNGIHLNVIEAASLGEGSAADESWRNINAMNDLALELIGSAQQLTVAALGGNTGAGGCFWRGQPTSSGITARRAKSRTGRSMAPPCSTGAVQPSRATRGS